MARTERPPNAAASLERLKAEVLAKLQASNLDRKPQRDEEGFYRSLLMNIQLLFSFLNPMTPAELRDNWLQEFEQQRKLYATVHRMEGEVLFIITTRPLPTWKIKDLDAWAAKLNSWAMRKLGPDGMSHCALLRLETRWSDEDEATTPVIGTLKDVLERIPVPLGMLTYEWMTQLLMTCTRIVLPESYRDGAVPLRPLTWSSAEKAIMMKIDALLVRITDFGSIFLDESTPSPYSYKFEMAIPSDTPFECADLKADPFFSFHFSEEVDKHATDAQKGLAKFIYANCARYAMTQYEAIILAQALMNQHTKKLPSKTFGKRVFALSPPGILHEYRTYMPDIFGVGEQSQDIREAISRYTSLVVDEYFGRQQKGQHTTGVLTKGKVKTRKQCAILQQRMSKMRSKLSNSIMAGMRSALLKLARGKSDSQEQLMKARLDSLERDVMARVDGLEREVKNRLELLESVPTEKVKQELMDFTKKP